MPEIFLPSEMNSMNFSNIHLSYRLTRVQNHIAEVSRFRRLAQRAKGAKLKGIHELKQRLAGTVDS